MRSNVCHGYRTSLFSSKLSLIDGISQDDNTRHIRFFVAGIKDFPVNEFDS